MRRAFGLALVLATVAAAPAGAQAPGPTILDFEGQTSSITPEELING